jgi:glucokinase
MASGEMISVEKAQRPLFLGIDVGGTNIKFGLVDDLGRTVAQHKIPTEQQRGPADAMRRSAQVIAELASQLRLELRDIAAVGLATPGTMDISKGILLQPHNLPAWWNFPIRDCLARECGKPVSFANDANAAAFGEFWVGSGSEFHSIAMFTLGTGVGGGIIIGGMSIDGENSAGSELGHSIIDYNDDARMCGCGQRGHLEAYASGKSVVRRAEEGIARGEPSSISDRIAAGDTLTPLVIAQEAEKGDALAVQVVMDTAMFLGIGAVNVMHTVDPGAVIFGGAMNFGGKDSLLGRKFLDRIRAEIHARAFPMLVRRTVIDFASLGSDAGYIGSAGIARADYQKSMPGGERRVEP